MDTPDACPHTVIRHGRDDIGPYAECEDCGEVQDAEDQ